MSVASGRAGQGPGGARPPGAAPPGVLEVTGRVPDDLAAGKRGPGGCGAYSVVQVRPMVRSRGAGSAAGCSHPFACRRPGAGAAWGGSASEEAVRRGQSRGRPRCRVRAAGQTQEATSRLAAGQEELFMPPAQVAGPAAAGGRCGQAADLPVAHAVEHQCEQPPGRGDFGDVAGFFPAAGDDAGLDRAGCRVCRCPLDRLDQRPAQVP